MLCPLLVCEGRAGGTDCVQLVVFAAQPPLAAAGAVDLMHLFALPLQTPDKSGTGVAAALDCPESIAGRVPICEADGVRVAACAGGSRVCAITAPVCASTIATACWLRCVSTPTT